MSSPRPYDKFVVLCVVVMGENCASHFFFLLLNAIVTHSNPFLLFIVFSQKPEDTVYPGHS